MCTMTTAQAENFLEVYKYVVPEFQVNNSFLILMNQITTIIIITY